MFHCVFVVTTVTIGEESFSFPSMARLFQFFFFLLWPPEAAVDCLVHSF
jgi:hypothetical protein